MPKQTTETNEKHLLYNSRILFFSKDRELTNAIQDYFASNKLVGLVTSEKYDKGVSLLKDASKKSVDYHFVFLDLENLKYEDGLSFYLGVREYTELKNVAFVVFNETANDATLKIIKARNFAKENSLKKEDDMNLSDLGLGDSGAEAEDAWIVDNNVRFVDRPFGKKELETTIDSLFECAYPNSIENVSCQKTDKYQIITIPTNLDLIGTVELQMILKESTNIPFNILDFANVKNMNFKYMQALYKVVAFFQKQNLKSYSINVDDDILAQFEQYELAKAFNVVDSIAAVFAPKKKK